MFMKAFQPYFEETQPNGAGEPEIAQEDEDSEEGPMEVEEGDDLRARNKAVRGSGGGRGYKRGAKGRRGGNRRGETENNSPKVAPAVSLPVTVRNELNLFDNLRVSLSKGNYQQLMKIIYLYTECVIGANEVYTMVKPLFRGNENYANLFQEMIFAREKTRRKNTELFKPLSDIDFESKDSD
jgi:histone deacetylase complex regulatory component SIN3